MKNIWLIFIVLFNSLICTQGFVEGTLVKTITGYKAIECVQTGDYVYCSDVQHNCTRQAMVNAITQEWSSSIVAIKIGDNTILSGPEHLFYLPLEQRWEQAQFLTRDHILISYHNEHVHITDVQHINQPAQLFDLSVDKHHTFFVSEQDIVVHNMPIITIPFAVPVAADLLAKGAAVLGAGVLASKLRSKHKNSHRFDNSHHQQSHHETQTKRDSQVYAIEHSDGTLTPVHASNTRDPRGTTTIDFAEANRQIEIREAAHIKRVEQQKKADQQVQKNVPKNKQQDKPKQQVQSHVEQKQPSVQPPKDPNENDKNKNKEKVDNLINDILKDAIPGKRTTGRTRQFKKTGGFEKALKDFEKMLPNNIREIVTGKGNTGKLGRLPDGRRINVRIDSSAEYPTLEIYNPVNESSIKIRYIK